MVSSPATGPSLSSRAMEGSRGTTTPRSSRATVELSRATEDRSQAMAEHSQAMAGRSLWDSSKATEVSLAMEVPDRETLAHSRSTVREAPAKQGSMADRAVNMVDSQLVSLGSLRGASMDSSRANMDSLPVEFLRPMHSSKVKLIQDPRTPAAVSLHPTRFAPAQKAKW